MYNQAQITHYFRPGGLSMTGSLDSITLLLGALVAGYLLGALPLADRISRRRGVDIFTTGTGLAGSSNVRRSVGRVPAMLVFAGDMAKGALAVALASLMGIEGVWLLLPAAAAIVGHWRSVFTGWRGGDGLATLGGVMIALFPVYGTIGVAVASVIALGGQKLPYTSLLSIVFGYGTLAALVVNSGDERALTVGLGGVAGLVLAHAILGHRRRRTDTVDEWQEELAEGEATQEQTQPR